MSNDIPIIMLTDAAAEHIRSVIERRGAGIGFRVSIKETGCSGFMYVPEIIDEVEAEDTHVKTSQGLDIYLEPTCEKILQGTTLDFVKKDLGNEQLIFDNPNVVGLCGCGESFKLKGDSA